MARRREGAERSGGASQGGMTGRSAFAVVLVVITVLFNVAMVGVYLNLRGDLQTEQERVQHCPAGWAGEGCLSGLQVAELGMDFLRIGWVVGDGLLGDALVILGIVWLAQFVRRRSEPVGPSRLVAEPGAEATRFIAGEERVGYLAGGARVAEKRRYANRVLVATPDGLEGWVDAGRLEPTGTEGGGDG